MARLEGNRRLILEREASGMDEEAGLHQQYTSVQLLRQKNKRLQRMAQLLAVAFVLLLVVAVASLITAVHGRQCQQSPDSQTVNHTSGFGFQQQQHKNTMTPTAMLTAPEGNITDGQYLQWENETGHVFCHGGFSCTRGDLVVPKRGIYRVFLQITYESKKGLICPLQILKLSNGVSVISDGYLKDETLLLSDDTVNCSMKQWRKSLYTSGLFLLEANSRLHANSLHTDLIVKDQNQVFFGAELVSVISSDG